jgi:putative uridylyltransferase
MNKPLIQAPSANSIVPGPIYGVASVILAGGQGTRLGFPGPKGLYEVLGRPLFCHLMDQIPLGVPVAVMTSPINHEDTVAFFKQRGLVASFFQQGLLPLTDAQGKMIGMGPDGNGGVFYHLVSSGLLDQFEQNGVDTVLISPVENPLADPMDARLLTHHRLEKADVTIKCVERVKGESMGAVTKQGIVEYFAIEKDDYSYSYMGQVALSVKFIRKAAALDLPYHRVLKKGVWKQERLLFDAFAFADKVEALCYARPDCYAPIKGPESTAIAEELLVGKK